MTIINSSNFVWISTNTIKKLLILNTRCVVSDHICYVVDVCMTASLASNWDYLNKVIEVTQEAGLI